MPTKHINFSQSLLGLGSNILQNLAVPNEIDGLWRMYQEDLETGRYPAKHSFDNFVLTIVFLYGIGAIEYKDHLLQRCT